MGVVNMKNESIRIVCIGTSHPGNIGAVARAIKNMGLTKLYLVSPRCCFPNPHANARAAGADDVLENAVVTDDLSLALQDCGLVIGVSARQRHIALPILTPRVSAEQIVREAQQTSVAILFGAEDAGLTNEELHRCHHQVQIPCNPEFSSLNLAAAVQLLSYEIYLANLAQPSESEAASDWASADEMERFYTHLEEILIDIKFLDPTNPKHLMKRLRRLYHRARPDKTEINILRGILTAVKRVL
jgi:tRNA (cytidine32/uridine32-2'-O)-methyltransferase